jgi:UDP-glucose/GDP-mannose dehydrogenase family, NAD binding domain/NMT1/THI5 like
LPNVHVNVVGLGYVGLPLAVALAEAGIRVLGVDVDEARVVACARAEADRGRQRRAPEGGEHERGYGGTASPCPRNLRADAGERPVRRQLNRPDPGYYKAAGVDVTLRPGGVTITPEPVVVAGKALVGLSSPSLTGTAGNQGADLKIIGAGYEESGGAHLAGPESDHDSRGLRR